MRVRYSYLEEQFSEPEEIFNEIKKLLKTGEFTLGPQVKEFEERFARLIGSKFAIGVGSGTDAIKLGLRAVGVGPGDEVITAANTFIATVGAINEIGARPVFVDCNENYVMQTDQIEEKITNKTKAIVPVHFTGEPVEMGEVLSVAYKHGLNVIEDACQSILCRYKDKTCGTFGDTGAFSLHPLKNLNVWADGGVIVTDDPKLDERLRLLRNHGLRNRDEISLLGYNSRLDSIQAIVGNWLIPKAEDITAQRIKNAKYYDLALSQISQILLPPQRDYVQRVYHLYMFRVPKLYRDELVKYLQDTGVEAKVHYPIPLYMQEGLRHLGHKYGDFPNTDVQSQQVVSVPVDQHVTKEMQDYVIERIEEFFS